ncbi:hypothetical protein ACPPVT_14115 [Angustibacter sp. McL0619]|uniref:hypothetical protein n=1 Tax=Angustibacter sp. McL0619 TaxID=3415676 RepID=UPI003CF91FD8
MGKRPVLLLGVCLTFVVLALGPGATGSAATTTGSLTWTARIDQQPVAQADANNPVVLHPKTGGHIELAIANRGATEREVRSVRLQGKIMGLTFFTYVTQLNLVLPAGSEAARAVDVDLSDLGDQAVGLVPTQLQLIGPQRNVLSSASFPVDVRGSFLSVYGIFGLALFGITALLLVSLFMRLALGRLPESRWQRALQFLPAGLGVGLVLTIGLSSTRLLLPAPSRWVPLVLGSGAIAFVAGYLTPSPNVDEAPPQDEAEGEPDAHDADDMDDAVDAP